MEYILTDNGLINSIDEFRRYNELRQPVYEVIRVIQGVPLFLEDHFNRLLKSIELQRMVFRMSYREYKQLITQLIEKNERTEGNVKFVFSEDGGQAQWAFFFIGHSYPDQYMYSEGVVTDLLYAERVNPNAKVLQPQIRDRANQQIKAQNLYEVLLVDGNGLITEGSRSNVFFIQSEVFYTAPASMVLEGITRRKVVECIRSLGYTLVEDAIREDELPQFDGVFITGTSPKVLPVRLVGMQAFRVSLEPLRNLMLRYDQSIDDYIQREKVAG